MMKKEFFREYSPALGRDMECQMYGHDGKVFLFIPCQDGHYYDFENFSMASTLAPWIESGQMRVMSIDTIDLETWSNAGGDARWRIERYEAWITYITREVVGKIRAIAGNDTPILTFGCSLGATHAANLFFRFPDLFSGCLALSGIYTAEYGFGNYMDDLVYQNSPVHYMANLPEDHPYIELYNRGRGVICAGQGAWEQPATTIDLKNICAAKGIDIWVDLWGYDVNHDWPWWYKQVEYFVPYLLAD